jgi:RNA-binding protein YhbY
MKKNGVIKSKTLSGETDFEKVHTLKKVAEKHAKKVRARGGKAVLKKLGDKKYKLVYKFGK